LTIDGVDFRIRSINAREKLLMNRIGLQKDKGAKETKEEADLRWASTIVGFCCVDSDGKRCFGPEDETDVSGWKEFMSDFAEWDAGTIDTLLDAIAKHTNLNRTLDSAVKKSDPTPISDSQ